MKPNGPSRRAAASRAFAALLAIAIPSAALAAGASDYPVRTPKPMVTPYRPEIRPASDEGEKAMANFEIPAGMKIELFAAEPMLANPVCFTIDNAGRFFVAETFRHHAGVTDMRDHRKWLLDDLACRTVEDRLWAMAKNLGYEFIRYSIHHDRVRLIEDADGDGKADRAEVFADGFNHALDGIGAGLLVDRGDVFWTCLPHVWRLRDDDGDGRSDARESMSYGYGVHNNFLGHDLHGLIKGPDGRLYFSIGDRGLHVRTREGKVLDYPDTGAVLRCYPDGSELEVFHTGLRNPQELAFDDYGNLFTGDNNSDAGDKARIVYLVEGGETGWHIGWQWMERPRSRGQWNAEKMWSPMNPAQPAYILPPIENLTSGPSGFAHYPGTGLGEGYADRFFLCDFRGNAGTSLIVDFALLQKGAWFSLGKSRQFTKGVLATDLAFGVEGGLYLTDWTQGWDQPRKGRIYRVYPPGIGDDPGVKETKRLLGEGMRARGLAELVGLLAHADRRVRHEAQWELADRAGESVGPLAELARSAPDVSALNPLQRISALNDRATRLPRLHAVWGLGQIAARSGDAEAKAEAAKALRALLGDPDHEIRANAARLVGDVLREEGDREALHGLLADASPRVRYFAATSIGKLGESNGSMEPLRQMLHENADADPYLRHAGVMGFLGAASDMNVVQLMRDPHPSVRLAGAIVARRRALDPARPLDEHATRALAELLYDPDTRVATEAARTIHDAPVPAAMPVLAAFAFVPSADAMKADDESVRNPMFLRALNASYRAGDAEGAKRVAAFAANPLAPETSRLEALRMIRDWGEAGPLDRVIGLWRPLEPRDGAPAREAIAPVLGGIVEGGSRETVEVAAEVAEKLAIGEAEEALFGIVADEGRSTSERVAAMKAIGAIGGPRQAEAVTIARASDKADLRMVGNVQLARLDPELASRLLGEAIATGETIEKQGAIAELAKIASAEADATLAEWLARAARGEAPPEIAFDLIEAARARGTESLTRLAAEYEAAGPKDDPLGPKRALLLGGSAKAGESAFFEKVEAQCARCHVRAGRGGGEAGPDLTGLGERKDRAYILRSILDPNADIAPGFENATLTLADGSEVAGRIVEETDETLLVEVPVEDEVVLGEFGEDDEFDEPGAAKEESAEAAGDGSAKGDAKPAATEGAPKKYERRTIAKREVRERKRNLSSMPADIATHLTDREIRDVVEFLAGP